MKDYSKGVIDGSPVNMQITQIKCEYNCYNVLTAVSVHKKEAELINHFNDHPDFKCSLGAEPYYSKAKNATDEAVKNLLNECNENEVGVR